MSDAAALLAAIRATPDDDAPRLIYADWLDEHGDPERAEFIRVQCELARSESTELRRREAELLAEHHDRFAGPLASPVLQFRFRRGLVVGFTHAGQFVRPGFGTAIRFFPDGTWLFGSAFGHPGPTSEVDVELLEPDVPGVASGTYVLDAFDAAVSFQLFCADYDKLRITCRGKFENGSIQLVLTDESGQPLHVIPPYEHAQSPRIDAHSGTW